MPDVRNIQPKKAIYYPHVEFGSAAWVKSALLYWEGLVRARPQESQPDDPPEVQELIAAGLIEELSPQASPGQALPEIGKRLEELISALGGQVPKCVPAIRGLRGTSPEHEQAARAKIVAELQGLPLIEKAFAETPDQARALFLSLWAEMAANEKSFAPVTDDPIFDALTICLESERVSQDPRTITPADGHAIAELSLPTPSLEAIADLSVERLLEVRRRLAPQRRHFREAVQARVAAIAQLPTAKAVQEQLKGLEDEIRDDLQATRDALKDARAKERWSLLGVGAPTSLSVAATIAAFAPVVGHVAGIGTLALGATSWFMLKRKGSRAPQNHYLLSLDKSMATPWQTLTGALRDLVRF
jgi:hypothetical protein